MAARRVGEGVAVLLLCAPWLQAQATCGEQLAQAVRGARGLVSAAHPAGIVANSAGGARHTLQDMSWMREQLQMIDSACLRGGDVEAAWRVEALFQRLQREGARAASVQAGSLGEPVVLTARHGSRMVKVEPSPSRLATSMLPP